MRNFKVYKILEEVNILECCKELHYNHSTVREAISEKKDFLNKRHISVHAPLEQHKFLTNQTEFVMDINLFTGFVFFFFVINYNTSIFTILKA